jgi:hypothetical protein
MECPLCLREELEAAYPAQPNRTDQAMRPLRASVPHLPGRDILGRLQNDCSESAWH